MKGLIIFSLCITVARLDENVCKVQPTQPNTKNCTSRLNCLHDECCVENYYTKRRQCEPLTKKGEYCLETDTDEMKAIKLKCPCKPDLYCNKELAVCMVEPTKPTTKNSACETGDDCSDDACCVMDLFGNHSTCQPLTKGGEYCLTDLKNISRAQVFTGICPCMSDFFCYVKTSRCVPNLLYEATKEQEKFEEEQEVRMVQPTEPTTKNCACEIGDDCSDDECCVKDFYGNHSTCQSLTKAGEYCLTDLKNISRAQVFTGVCPCMSDFFCYVKTSQCVPNFLYEATKEQDEFEEKNKCSNGKDCPESHCCVYDSLSNLPGKKYCLPLLNLGKLQCIETV